MASIYISKLQRQPRNACSNAGSDVDARRRKRKAIVRNFVDPLRQNVKYERHGGDNDNHGGCGGGGGDGGRWEAMAAAAAAATLSLPLKRAEKLPSGEHPTEKLFRLLLLLLLLVLSAVLLLKVTFFFRQS